MAKRPVKKRPAAGQPAPAEPEARGSWLYTISFSLAVVAFIIGVYQTLVEQDLAGNYWLFMIAAGLLLLIRWDRLRAKQTK